MEVTVFYLEKEEDEEVGEAIHIRATWLLKIPLKWFLKSFKGTNGRQKTCEIFHVYCIFYSGFMCQTTVIFGITEDGSLLLNALAS